MIIMKQWIMRKMMIWWSMVILMVKLGWNLTNCFRQTPSDSRIEDPHVSPWPAIANHIDSSNHGSVLFTNQLGSTVLPVSTNNCCLKGPKVSLSVNPGAPRWMQSSKSNLRLTLTNSGQLAEPRRWSDAVWLMILRIHLMDSNGLCIKSVYSLRALSDSSFSAISDLILRALNPQSLCVFNISTWLFFFAAGFGIIFGFLVLCCDAGKKCVFLLVVSHTHRHK